MKFRGLYGTTKQVCFYGTEIMVQKNQSAFMVQKKSDLFCRPAAFVIDSLADVLGLAIQIFGIILVSGGRFLIHFFIKKVPKTGCQEANNHRLGIEFWA